MEARERAELVLSVAERLPEGRFAAQCKDIAAQVLALGDQHLEASCMLAGMGLEVVWELWLSAQEIENLEAEQRARSQHHPRRLRMLTAAEVPLWVLSAVQDVSMAELRRLTPEKLLALAGLEDFGSTDLERESLSQAGSALHLLRALALLGVEPSHLSELLALLEARVNDTDDRNGSSVRDVPIPVRPCHPPGELVLAGPCVPRAPGMCGPLPFRNQRPESTAPLRRAWRALDRVVGCAGPV